jgi:cytochrome c-type biogenesis protein
VTLEQLLQSLGAGVSHSLLTVVGITFLGGILSSAICPCTLPVGVGVAGAASASEARLRRSGLQLSMSFFAGIVMSLTILGGFAGWLGALATESFGRRWALTMAVLSLAAAIVILRWSRVKNERLVGWRRPGLLGSFGYGVIFSVGTSIAPLLLLLAVVATEGRTEYGSLMAFVFGLGRGLPFLLAGLAGSAIIGLFPLGSWTRAVHLVSVGALLIVSAYYVNVYVQLL